MAHDSSRDLPFYSPFHVCPITQPNPLQAKPQPAYVMSHAHAAHDEEESSEEEEEEETDRYAVISTKPQGWGQGGT